MTRLAPYFFAAALAIAFLPAAAGAAEVKLGVPNPDESAGQLNAQEQQRIQQQQQKMQEQVDKLNKERMEQWRRENAQRLEEWKKEHPGAEVPQQ